MGNDWVYLQTSANRLHSVIIRSLLAEWLDLSFEGWKHEHKLAALIVLYDFTLTNKHAVIQMGTLHDLARTEAILTWKPLCSQYCQLPSIKQQTYEKSWIKSKIVMAVSSWPSGRVCANYFNAMFTFAELKPSRQSWSLCWDTCTGPKIPNYLVYLEHSCVTLQWKVLFLINFRSLLQCCIHPGLFSED